MTTTEDELSHELRCIIYRNIQQGYDAQSGKCAYEIQKYLNENFPQDEKFDLDLKTELEMKPGGAMLHISFKLPYVGEIIEDNGNG